MITNRIRVSKEATEKMKQLKTKLKIGPMYSVARLAFIYSLDDPRNPQEEFYREDGMEFNRLTLLGDHDPIYLSLLKERGLYKKSKSTGKLSNVNHLPPKEMTSLLSAHINRGIIKLHARVKNQDDLLEIVQEQQV